MDDCHSPSLLFQCLKRPYRGEVFLAPCPLEQLVPLEERLMQGLVEDLLSVIHPLEEHVRSRKGEPRSEIQEHSDLLDSLMQEPELEIL